MSDECMWTPPFDVRGEWVIDAKGVIVARSFGPGVMHHRAAEIARTLNFHTDLRMCVACGKTRPAELGRESPHDDCTAPDACTWDMTPQEAADHWRKLAHDLHEEIKRLTLGTLA